MSVLELRGIRKSYGNGKEKLDILRVASLDVHEGDFLVIEGPSGCGKSTLLNLMGLLDRPTAGTLRLDGVDMARAAEKERSLARNRKIGFVFQQFSLLPDLDALDNVALPLVAAGVPRAQRMERARSLLDRVGLRQRERRYPSQLSGGEQQRVAIARALVNGSRVLLADEPTGNLDRSNTEAVMDLFQEINKEAGTAIVLVTHDSEVAKRGRRVLRELVHK